jgi:hypothetical protein
LTAPDATTERRPYSLGSDSPFPGLRPFDFHDAEWFFGREREVIDLLRRLAQTRFLVVTGDSGSGKSSLVRAGLLPKLANGALCSDGGSWWFAVTTPGTAPLTRLGEALGAAVDSRRVMGVKDARAGASADGAVNQRGFRAEFLGFDPKALAELYPALKGNDRLLIVIDQFEELFRPDFMRREDWLDQATMYVQTLLEASTLRGGRIFVMFTMRSDFLGPCDRIPTLVESINDNCLYLVPRLSRRAVRDLIIKPLERAEVIVSDEAVRRVAEIFESSDQDRVPLLQYALRLLWDKGEQTWRKASKLELADWEKFLEEFRIGQGDPPFRVLSKLFDASAEALIASESDQRVKDLQLIFREICEVTQDRIIRNPKRVKDLVLGAMNFRPSVEDLFERLTGNGPLIVARERTAGEGFGWWSVSTSLTEDSILDVPHECVPRHWNRFKEAASKRSAEERIGQRLGTTEEMADAKDRPAAQAAEGAQPTKFSVPFDLTNGGADALAAPEAADAAAYLETVKDSLNPFPVAQWQRIQHALKSIERAFDAWRNQRAHGGALSSSPIDGGELTPDTDPAPILRMKLAAQVVADLRNSAELAGFEAEWLPFCERIWWKLGAASDEFSPVTDGNYERAWSALYLARAALAHEDYERAKRWAHSSKQSFERLASSRDKMLVHYADAIGKRAERDENAAFQKLCVALTRAVTARLPSATLGKDAYVILEDLAECSIALGQWDAAVRCSWLAWEEGRTGGGEAQDWQSAQLTLAIALTEGMAASDSSVVSAGRSIWRELARLLLESVIRTARSRPLITRAHAHLALLLGDRGAPDEEVQEHVENALRLESERPVLSPRLKIDLDRLQQRARGSGGPAQSVRPSARSEDRPQHAPLPPELLEELSKRLLQDSDKAADEAWDVLLKSRAVPITLQRAGFHFEQDSGISDEEVQKRIDAARKNCLGDLSDQTRPAGWWREFEEAERHRPRLVLRLLRELEARATNVRSFFESYGRSDCNNSQANLDFLDYTKLTSQKHASHSDSMRVETDADESVAMWWSAFDARTLSADKVLQARWKLLPVEVVTELARFTELPTGGPAARGLPERLALEWAREHVASDERPKWVNEQLASAEEYVETEPGPRDEATSRYWDELKVSQPLEAVALARELKRRSIPLEKFVHIRNHKCTSSTTLPALLAYASYWTFREREQDERRRALAELQSAAEVARAESVAQQERPGQ